MPERPASAAPRPSTAAPAPAPRRGGFGDSGGVTGDGELPIAKPLYVASEKELRAEMERIGAGLEPSVQWNKRIEALLVLEGLTKGNAADYLEAFIEVRMRCSRLAAALCRSYALDVCV